MKRFSAGDTGPAKCSVFFPLSEADIDLPSNIAQSTRIHVCKWTEFFSFNALLSVLFSTKVLPSRRIPLEGDGRTRVKIGFKGEGHCFMDPSQTPSKSWSGVPQPRIFVIPSQRTLPTSKGVWVHCFGCHQMNSQDLIRKAWKKQGTHKKSHTSEFATLWSHTASSFPFATCWERPTHLRIFRPSSTKSGWPYGVM